MAVKLYEYQKKALATLPSRAIMAWDTGTGKSFSALAHYDKHAYPAPLLILAPASKVKTGDWERDIELYFEGRLPPVYEVYSYERFSRNVSTATYRKTGHRPIHMEWLDRYPRGYAVIADEVHRAKSPQSLTGKAVYNVAGRAASFVGLSATALPNGWIDAINYFKIFGFTKHKTDFKNRYVDEVNYKGFPEIVGYRREEELQRLWNKIAKPLKKADALDLPPLTSIPVRLDAGTDYPRILKEHMFDDKLLDNPSAMLHALRQSMTPPKVQWLDDFLEGTSDNVVVFYNYKSERDVILDMIKKKHNDRTVFRQDGEKHEVPSKSDWGGLHRTITVAQYQSGSTGIEMSYAASTVYFSPTYSYTNYEQSIGRTYRNGQTNKVSLYLLCAPTTIEKDIWAALHNKGDFQERQWLTKLNP